MKRLQPVIWMKGTFLSPQYLQTQDRFIESTLEFYMDALSFAPWGFKRLQINQDALDQGTFALTEATGIFPDGLIFDIPDSDPPPSPKLLVDCFEPDQKSLDVFLAIPHYRDRGLNVSIAQKKADTRFLAEVAMLRDENSGLTEKPVQVARKNFRFLLEGESQQHTSVLRVARVLKTEAGTLQLDPDFVPPLLDITASDFLVSISRRLVEILAAKSTTLVRQPPPEKLEPRRVRYLRYRELLAALHHQFAFPADAAHLRNAPRTSRASLLHHALPGRLSDHVFERHSSARSCRNTSTTICTAASTISTRRFAILLETVVPSNFISLPLKLIEPVHLRNLAGRRQVPAEHAHVSGGQLGDERGRTDQQDAVPDQGLFRQPHRGARQAGASGRRADAHAKSA